MKKKRGFTLIELILVMVILGVLMAIGAGAFLTSLKKGRDTTRKANLRAIAGAVEMYYNDKGKYPTGSGGSISGCYTAGGSTGACGKDYPIFKDSITNGAMYMAKFPVDPVSLQQYYYISANGKQYQIYAHLENDQDPQCLQTDGVPNCTNPTVPSGVNCGASTTVACNYGVSSANTNP